MISLPTLLSRNKEVIPLHVGNGDCREVSVLSLIQRMPVLTNSDCLLRQPESDSLIHTYEGPPSTNLPNLKVCISPTGFQGVNQRLCWDFIALKINFSLNLILLLSIIFTEVDSKNIP